MISRPLALRLLEAAPLLLFMGVILLFGTQSAGFLTTANAAQVLAQAAPTIIVAVGMTFVLLTAGVDLSVGALMFIGAGVAGHLAIAGYPLPVSIAVMEPSGLPGEG